MTKRGLIGHFETQTKTFWNSKSKARYSATLTYNPQAYHEDHKHGTGTNSHKPERNSIESDKNGVRKRQIHWEISNHLRFKYKSSIKINSI